MSTTDIRYWGYRIDTFNRAFFLDELRQGRLRQGWGWEGQDLRYKENLAPEAHRNLRMFNEVKEGHTLLVPSLPEPHLVAIVEATEDWNRGYRFEVSDKENRSRFNDYGHIFPARLYKWFSREARPVTGDVRASLRYVGRFWNMDRHRIAIEAVKKTEQECLDKSISDEGRLKDEVQSAFRNAFNESWFRESVYGRLNEQFDNARWETVLVRVLQTLYPAPCEVTREGGRTEKSHGTDILIALPGLGAGPRHVIAVQVKDWEGSVTNDPVEQIRKASWWAEEGDHVIEKVVIMTKVHRNENTPLVKYAEEHDVRLVFADDLKEMLTEYAKRTMGHELAD